MAAVTAGSCLVSGPSGLLCAGCLVGQAAAGPLGGWVDADGPVVVHVQQGLHHRVDVGVVGELQPVGGQGCGAGLPRLGDLAGEAGQVGQRAGLRQPDRLVGYGPVGGAAGCGDGVGGQPPHRPVRSEESNSDVHHARCCQGGRVDGAGGQVPQLGGYRPGVGDEHLLGGVQAGPSP